MDVVSVIGEDRIAVVPAISVVDGLVLMIEEGPFKDVWFTISDLDFDPDDECVLSYTLRCAGATAAEIKPIVDDYIIMVLQNAARSRIDDRNKNENQVVK